MQEGKWNAIYARQSADKADSISIDSQIEFCRYEARGEPYKVYVDKGFSGKNTSRPQFLEMLNDVRNGNITRVICYKLDRCSRSILDFIKLIEEFKEFGVEFISCTEKFDTSTPMGRAMLSICVVFAQLERETIQQRIFDTYHDRSRRGFYMGGKIPFGFQLESCAIGGKKTARYSQVAEEAEILLRMYSMYRDPQISQADVAQMLNACGQWNPRRKDGRWDRSHISRMLKNPIYVKADWSIYNYFMEQNATIINDPEDFIGVNGCYKYHKDGETRIVLAPHEGIVDSELWLQCVKKSKNY